MSDDLVKRLRIGIHTSADEQALRDEAASRIEKLEAALRKIMNLGQSAVPDHWEARCLARDTARKALEGKDD
jgi:hypothetical protein